MGISNTFRITGSALSAQSIHLEAIAKNMANAQVVSSSESQAYRARRPVFASVLNSNFGSSLNGSNGSGFIFGNQQADSVRVKRFEESNSRIERQHMPESPLADENGYIYLSNVNVVEEMFHMMQASRSYQSNVEVMNTSKQLMLRTLSLGNS